MSAPVVNGRKLSWVRDRLKRAGERADFRAAHLLGAAPPPANSSNGDLVVTVLDQGGLGSCTAHGTAQAIRALMVLAGVAAPKLVSRLWAYYLARSYDHDTANDDGTQIRQVFAGLVKYGLPPEEAWPYSDDSSPGAPFSRMPPPEAWRAAFDAKFAFSAHRIDSTGAARVDDIKRALGQRRLVTFGTDVSEQFCSSQFDPMLPLPPPVGLPIAGGHCMAIVDHDGDVFRVVNSWSDGWGDGGYSRFSADYLAWDGTNDLWVVDASPADLGGAT